MAATAHDNADAIRKRAKQRLIGSTVLVLLGILGFPLLFETQPRPIPVDIPIEIPAKNSVKPLPAPVPQKAAPASPAPVEKVLPSAPAPAVDKANPSPVKAALPADPVKAPEPKAVPATQSKPSAQSSIKPEAKAEPVAAPQPLPAEPKPTPDEAARASALLNGADSAPATPPKSTDAAGRFIVQVGAFADVSKAREVRAQLEKAGLKTYTHVAETPQGKRIRVRVGPFASRAEADKTAQRIKTMDLPAAILTL